MTTPQKLHLSTEQIKDILKIKKVYIALLTKNVIKTIEKILNNALQYGKYFFSYQIIIIDGHSVDGTYEFCKKWCEDDRKYRYIYIQKSKEISRPLALSEARNMYIELLEPYFDKDTYLIIMDSDEINISDIDENGFLSNFDYNLTEWDAMCCNQSIVYYDIWALRNEECPYDCWDMIKTHGNEQKYLRNHQKPKSRDTPLIKCNSAFGGLAIYHTEKLKGCRYYSYGFDGRNIKELCEHVPFNYALINNGGKIFINPNFINGPGPLT